MARIQLSRKLTAFLDLCGLAEGTTTNPQTADDGYDLIPDGDDGWRRFELNGTHPFADGRAPVLSAAIYPPGYTTAAGRYLITLDTWAGLAEMHHFGRFTPEGQDRAALALLAECGAYVFIMNDRIPEAIERASLVWSSFPGDMFHPGRHTLADLVSNYKRLLTEFQD
jgi:muramidase (phage lysozyme)